jgi:hypothetical protein
MITFKQFLREDDKEFYKSDMINHVAEWINRDCSQFLSASNGKHLYRGLKVYHPDGGLPLAMRISHPTDRAPKDSGSLFNDIFNKSIEQKFGVADIRKKTIFATGDARQARQYGPLFFFFPIGEFQFAYSPSVTDSYEDAEQLWKDVANAISGHKAELIKMAPHNVTEANFDDYGPTGWLIEPYALKRIFTRLGNEGWHELPEKLSDSYVAQFVDAVKGRIDNDYAKFDGEQPSMFFAQLGDCIEVWWPLIRKLILRTFANSYEINTELSSAISGNVEILFYASRGYYAVSVTHLRETYVSLMTDSPDDEGNTGHLHAHYYDHRDIEDDALYEWFIQLGKKHGKAD